MIDATCPWGFDHLLPRGLLREPVASLARADAAIVTRCQEVSEPELAAIIERISQLVPAERIAEVFTNHRREKQQSANEAEPAAADR